jgi:hypothetical protein
MIDTPDITEPTARNGHFICRVRRREGGAWSWRLQVEVIGNGQMGVFDSMVDALRFMREHLTVDEDAEPEGGGL